MGNFFFLLDWYPLYNAFRLAACDAAGATIFEHDGKMATTSWSRLAVRVALITWIAITTGTTRAATVSDAPGSQRDIRFGRDIRPLLAKKCLLCHGPDEAEGGLRLDQHKNALGLLESGKRAVVPHDVNRSELVRRVTAESDEERMPPDGDPLAADEVQLLRRWIQAGAPWDLHWAYQPISPPAPPPVHHGDWVRNPIDRFVLARLEAEQIEPSVEADRYTLIKRLSYDLVGLPPEPEEVDAFFSDTSAAAYEKLADRLLASPHFGERWGRHWLDKARYADSDGYEKDNVRNDAWHYRDWVIGSINQDMPFDEFTVQQLAGDLLPDATPATRLATAFNRQTLTNTEGGTDQEQWRVAAVMDRTETLGTVWLGLTVGCARCHSHKYDQITQSEYYRLFAFFNNADETNTDLPVSDRAIVKYEKASRAYERAVAQQEARLLAARADNEKDAARLEKELTALKKSAPALPTISVRVISERRQKRRKTHVLRRGEFREPLDEVRPGTLSSCPPLRARSSDGGTDRLDLAHGLVDGRNPLTPRVSVNQIWKHLFGEGLVRTPADFGVRGDRPTHPGLLDFLAGELIRNGWSRKAIIKQIVMSATYRQSSHHRTELLGRDPTNRHLSRQNRYRVEAETVRDISLAASGLLVRRIGGRSVFPPIPDSITALTYNSSFKWVTSTGGDRHRRGMYTFFKRTAPHPNLITFDCPDSNVTNVQRTRSNTPIGALVTLNNPVYVDAARAMARRVLREELSGDGRRITRVFRLCVARPPRHDEVARLVQLLRINRAWYDAHESDAADLVGDYATAGVPISELATWVATSRMVMNLDEFITRE